jgi:hypothetical protein
MFFIAQKIIKVSAPSKDKEKSTAEYAEVAEGFWVKTKKTNHSIDPDFFLPFDPPGIEARG